MATKPAKHARPAAGLLLAPAAKHRPYAFRLYVAGMTGRSAMALRNIQDLCEELLPGRYSLEVVDLIEDPGKASVDEIIALPTLVRIRPKPVRKVLGDLSDRGRVLLGLDLMEHGP